MPLFVAMLCNMHACLSNMITCETALYTLHSCRGECGECAKLTSHVQYAHSAYEQFRKLHGKRSRQVKHALPDNAVSVMLDCMVATHIFMTGMHQLMLR